MEEDPIPRTGQLTAGQLEFEDEVLEGLDGENIFSLFRTAIIHYIERHHPMIRNSPFLKDYDLTLSYLVELAVGEEPTTIPPERKVRDMFGLLGNALVPASDYQTQEVDNEVYGRALDRASLAHADQVDILAKGYRSLPVSERVLYCLGEAEREILEI